MINRESYFYKTIKNKILYELLFFGISIHESSIEICIKELFYFPKLNVTIL